MASGDVFADQFGLADGLTQDIQPALGVSVMITQIMCSGSFINNADHFSLKADGGTMYFWYSGVEL